MHTALRTLVACSNDCAASIARLQVMNIAVIVVVVSPSVWLPNRLNPTSKVPTANDAKSASSIEACTKRLRDRPSSTARVGATAWFRPRHDGASNSSGTPAKATTSAGQFNMPLICPTATPITGPASQVPNAGPAMNPTKDALPSSTKRRLRSMVELRSAM